MLNFAFSLSGEPVVHYVRHLLVAMLSQSEEQEVVVNQSELASVVVDAICELVDVLHLVYVIVLIVIFNVVLRQRTILLVFLFIGV